MARILEGIRVLDWTHYVVGPVGTMLLADFGAEVIHLEDPTHGDRGRHWMRYMGVDSTLPGGRSIQFESCNRNKLSITVDLSKPSGLEIAYRLVKTCDVFVQNMRPGAAEKLGMGYDALSSRNPNLVYVSSTGMGASGPEAGFPTTDFIVQAKSGLLQADEQEEPEFRLPGIGDDIGGITVFAAALLGLVHRSARGRGLHLHASQFGTLLASQRWLLSFYMLSGKKFLKHDRRNAPNPSFNWYRCSDLRWLACAVFHPENEWRLFCQAIGYSELLDDARFASVDSRQQHSTKLVALLDEWFAKKPAADWEKQLREAGVLGTVINTYADLTRDPQALLNDFIFLMNDPTYGEIPTVGNPIQVEDASGVAQVRKTVAPAWGQDTEAVLLGLGYTWGDIGRLRNEGAI